ncbi:MAG: hypothetical protein GX361_10465 [Bacteroidales bacterium]|nr:hypothetical protein [Bacteroidales bacterium]
MKKLFFIAIFAVGISAFASAQVNDKAIGIRTGWGTEFSYQHPFSSANRLEVDLGLYGWKHSEFALSGIYQWLFGAQGGFNVFAGFGPQVGSWYWGKEDKNTIGVGVAGQLGVEYNFDFPLQLSLDWRPSWVIIPTDRGFGYEGVALGIRYRF